jgi:hypothetical protein
VHSVGDLVRELDGNYLEAGGLDPAAYSSLESAPAMQPT